MHAHIGHHEGTERHLHRHIDQMKKKKKIAAGTKKEESGEDNVKMASEL
jgi:hypothetical protein